MSSLMFQTSVLSSHGNKLHQARKHNDSKHGHGTADRSIGGMLLSRRGQSVTSGGSRGARASSILVLQFVYQGSASFGSRIPSRLGSQVMQFVKVDDPVL